MYTMVSITILCVHLVLSTRTIVRRSMQTACFIALAEDNSRLQLASAAGSRSLYSAGRFVLPPCGRAGKHGCSLKVSSSQDHDSTVFRMQYKLKRGYQTQGHVHTISDTSRLAFDTIHKC